MVLTTGEANLLNERFNEVVENVAPHMQVLRKKVCLVKSSNAGEEHFYQKTASQLSGSANLGFGAELPRDVVDFAKVTVRPRLFGIESGFTWQDTKIRVIDVQRETMKDMLAYIEYQVALRVWNIISESQSAVNIRTLATAATWNNATRSSRIPHEDIFEAKSVIMDSQTQRYKPNICLLSPTDAVFVVTNDYVLGSFDASSPAVMKSGSLGTIAGLELLEDPVITADYSWVGEAKRVATWWEQESLRTKIILNEPVDVTLKAWQMGDVNLTNPKAACLITNTQA